jgi:hypothetical protein
MRTYPSRLSHRLTVLFLVEGKGSPRPPVEGPEGLGLSNVLVLVSVGSPGRSRSSSQQDQDLKTKSRIPPTPLVASQQSSILWKTGPTSLSVRR